MKGRKHKMLKRVTVSMLVLAMTLSNMSVAAETSGQAEEIPANWSQEGTPYAQTGAEGDDAAVISADSSDLSGAPAGHQERTLSAGLDEADNAAASGINDSEQATGGNDKTASSGGKNLPDDSAASNGTETAPSTDPSVSDDTVGSDNTNVPAVTAEPDENPTVTDAPSPEESPAVTGTPSPEESPAATGTPGPEESPAVTGTPGPDESPAVTGTPNPDGTPSVTAAPNPEESPAASATPNPAESPAASATPNPDQEEPADTEEDFSDLMTIEELEALPETEVGATMWKTAAASFFGMMRSAAAGDQSDASDDPNEENALPEETYGAPDGWEFDTYYVNSDNPKEKMIQNDANVKYQMVFHTDIGLKPNTVEIRIPYSLFRYRGEGDDISGRTGDFFLPAEADIAVPRAQGSAPENAVYSKNTPFNYYIDNLDEDGNPTESSELVFFNYRKITAGSNAAWQVLYRNLDIMRTVDETRWSLSSAAVVTKTQKAEAEGAEPTVIREGITPAPLTGSVNTGVSVTEVTKTPYHEEGKQYYTPLLYTEAQVRRYIDGDLPADFTGTDEEGNDNFSKWKYAVWEVTAEGEATQPWNLKISENPDIIKTSAQAAAGAGKTGNCRIVGYRSNPSSYYNHALRLSGDGSWTWDQGNQAWTAAAETFSSERNLRSRFWVVVAYPGDLVASTASEDVADTLSNAITVTMEPVDTPTKATSKASEEAVYKYVDYRWEYNGDTISIKKISNTGNGDEKKKEYDSWLEAYSRTSADQDYGSIYFSSTSSMRGYGLTHYTATGQSGEIYGLKEGHFYEMTTADDFMYAEPDKPVKTEDGEKSIISLDWQDYYYNGVTVTQRDIGYDPMEAAETDTLDLPGQYRETYVYAMFAKPAEEENVWTEDNKNTWEPVNKGQPILRPEDGNSASYTFTAEELAREPWRVKVVHRGVEYRTECDITVNVCLRRTPSADLQAVMDAYKKGEITSVKLQDLSAAMAKYTQTGEGGTVKKDENGNPVMTELLGEDPNYGQYEGITDLSAATKALYSPEEGWSDGHLPMRSNAYAVLHGLRKEARAFKKAKTTNDVTNGRVLVDYFLTAYDSYRVQDQESLQYLKNLGVPTPGKNYVMFYDLLPHGVSFDPSVEVIAGRITQLDENSRYQSQSNYWDDTDVNVTTEVVDDWNHTGRDMVVFRIEYTGEDPAVYTSGKWLDGWGVSFRANYAWKDMDAVEKQYNISAFMPDVEKYENKAVELLGDKVYREKEIPDDSAYTPFAGGINPANDAGTANILYAKHSVLEDMATAGLSNIEKLVRADSDIFAMFKEDAYVEAGKGYTYEITVEAQAADLKDLVVFDHLENAVQERQNAEDPNAPYFGTGKIWHGTFRSVELNGLADLDVKPVIWYNGSREALTSGSTGAGTMEEILSSNNGWYQEAEYIAEYKKTVADDELEGRIKEYAESRTEAQLDLLVSKYRREHPQEAESDADALQKAAITKVLAMETVQSVAVDFRKTTDNNDFILEKGRTIRFQIKMQAPDNGGTEALYAFNNPSYYSAPADETAEGTTGTTQTGDSVRVRLGAEYSLEVSKEFEGEVPQELQKQAFTFRLYREEAVKDEAESGEAGESGEGAEAGGEETGGNDEDAESRGTLENGGAVEGGEAGGNGETGENGENGSGKTDGSGETEEGVTVQKAPLANKSYTLWVKTPGEAGGEDIYTQKKDRPYATDENGCFTLQAGQKAIFDNVADAKDIIVEEAESVYWESTDRITEKEGTLTGKKILVHAVTNKYRNVLYVQKKVEGVPEGTTLTEKELTFLFQVVIEGQNAPLQYCLVDGIKTNGDSPKILEFPGETAGENSVPEGQTPDPGDAGNDSGENAVKDSRFRMTDNEGRFKIREGWTIALFLDSVNAKYTLTELYTDEDGQPNPDLWVKNDSVSGVVSYNGAAARVTNHYKWKDFYLTKELLHQDPANCNEVFTFQILKQVEETKDGQTVTRWEPVNTENQWTLLEKDGSRPEGSGGLGGGTAGSEGGIRDADMGAEMSRGSVTSGENEPETESSTEDSGMAVRASLGSGTTGTEAGGGDKDNATEMGSGDGTGENTGNADSTIRDPDVLPDPEKPGIVLTKGQLDENGIFAARCAGKMIKIEGLEAGATYKIVEINVPENYQPGYLKNGQFVPFGEGEGLEVTIPVYGDGMKATITNDYLLRPLSVTKQVLSEEPVDAVFTMILTKAKADAADKIEGGEIKPEDCEPVSRARYRINGDDGLPKKTSLYGEFYLRDGETAVFEDLGKTGDVFILWEVQETGEGEEVMYPQILPAGGTSEFIFRDPEMTGGMLLRGMIDQAGGSEGIEKSVTVGAPLKAVLTDEGIEVKFLNGVPGLLMIRKVYEDESGEAQWIMREIFERGEDLYSEQGIYKRIAELEALKKEETNVDIINGELKQLQVEIARLQPDRWNDDRYDVRVHLGLKNGDQIVDWDPTVSSETVKITCIDEILDTVFQIKGTSDGEGGYDWEILREEAELNYVYNESERTVVETGSMVWKNDGHDAEAILAFDKGSFNIKPWMTYVIQIGAETGYIVEEQDPYHYDAENQYVISPKAARAEGNVSSDPSVTLINEIRRWRFLSPIEKRMTPDSYPVPAGKTLVWCVQCYDALTKTWKAEEGIEYVILEGNEEDGIYSSSEAIQRTGQDGKIILTREKNENTYLAVQFFDSAYASHQNRVPYLNPLKPWDGMLRIVELLGPESGTDEAWGTLVGYGAEGMNGRYGMDVYTSDIGNVTTIVNSNRMTRVRVEKRTEQPYGETFTMFLRQLTGSGEELPRQGIEYKVYDKEGMVRSDVTGSNGEIRLEDGQYAELSLPSELEWRVSEAENEEPGAVESFILKEMTREDDPESILTKISRNLMQIERKETESEGTTFITKYDVQRGVVDAETGESVNLKEGNVTIPKYIRQNGMKYRVVGIGIYAFSGQKLTKVSIPEGVGIISDCAFAGCENLEEAVIPNGVKEIGVSAFGECVNLSKVDIPEGIEKVGGSAFRGTALTQVVIPDSMTRIENSTFANCTRLESITIGRNVTEIGTQAFIYCSSLKKLVLPASLQTIESRVFVGCPLEELTINSDIAFGDGGWNANYVFGTIDGSGKSTFGTLKKLTINAKIPNFREKFNAGGNSTLSDWCPNLEQLIITENGEIDAINVNVGDLPHLNTLTIEGIVDGIGVNSGGLIGSKDPGNNSALKTLTLNGEIGVINAKAFMNCTALEILVINGRVGMIDASAFENCTALTTVEINGIVGPIDSTAFNNCGVTDFTVAEDALVEAIGIGTVSAKGYPKLTNLTINGTVNFIGDQIFSNSMELETVTINGTVEQIAEYAFSRQQRNQSVLGTEPVDSDDIPVLNFFIRNKPERGIDVTAFSGEAVRFHLGGQQTDWNESGYPWGADTEKSTVEYNWNPAN